MVASGAMGASGWHYFVPFDTDVTRALNALREDVFQRGTYYSPSKKKPKTIDALMRQCGEDGTHSVLDVTRVVTEPFSPIITSDELGSPEQIEERVRAHVAAIGAVGPVPESWLTENCGTSRPDRAEVEVSLFDLFELCPRGAGVWTTVYTTAGAPIELLFVGKTGD